MKGGRSRKLTLTRNFEDTKNPIGVFKQQSRV